MFNKAPQKENHQYTNRLVHSASPYLLQHAHNPVEWYPWGEEALQKAKEEDKPILVSIGYSTCYWCHVMEREVFENPDIAALMNQWFVNIKIDREERPDLDEIYMLATQLITRQGGWPNNVFLTPDLQPFFAGTYFGSEDAFGRPGFPNVLQSLHHYWQNQRDKVLESADTVAAAIKRTLGVQGSKLAEVPVNEHTAYETYNYLAKYHDARDGGFYQAPKFPQETYLLFLIEYYRHTHKQEALSILTLTADKIAAGGIYDQIGGGFHRYATDKEWLVPHFEKMLYNQALMARVYTELYEVTEDSYYRDVAAHTLDYVAKSMTDQQRGGFFSAYDAETDAVEGKYYIWTTEEIQQLLPPGEYALFNNLFHFAPIPEIPGHHTPEGEVLYLRTPLNQADDVEHTTYELLAKRVSAMMGTLLDARNKRKAPMLDTKIITSWNGLMIDAFARAGMTLENKSYIDIAEKAARFVLDNLYKENRLYRIYAKGQAYQKGFFEDYSFLIQGLISIYRSTQEHFFLDRARELIAVAEQLFWDTEQGGYYFIDGSEPVLIRLKNGQDNAIPSGNAVMVHALLDLYEINDETAWLEKAESIIAAFSGDIRERPLGYTHMVQGALRVATIRMNGNHKALSSDSAKKTVLREVQETATEVVHISARLVTSESQEGEPFKVKIVLDMKEGWHINANPASFDYLIPTSIDIQSTLPIEVMDISYPVPEIAGTAAEGRLVHVYKGQVAVVVTLKVNASIRQGDNLRVLVRFQPCNDNACLSPEDRVVMVAL